MAQSSMSHLLVSGLITVLVPLVLFAIERSSINAIPKLDEGVLANRMQVENQHWRRADLVPSLVTTASGAADFKRATLTAVVEAHAKVSQMTIPKDILKNRNVLQRPGQNQGASTQALSRLLIGATDERKIQTQATSNFEGKLSGNFETGVVEFFALHEGEDKESSTKNPHGATDGSGGLRHILGGSAILIVFLLFVFASDLGVLPALAIVFFLVWLVQGFPKGGFRKQVWKRATDIVNSWENHFGHSNPSGGKLESGSFINSPYFMRMFGRGKYGGEGRVPGIGSVHRGGRGRVGRGGASGSW